MELREISASAWLNLRQYLWLWVALFSAFVRVQGVDPRDGFCRRWGHQTTVVDDKLYIDGGYVTFNTDKSNNYSNRWNSYHDLKHSINDNSTNSGWPILNTSLARPPAVPVVHGGVLWGDSVNKRYYLYGGQSTTENSPEPFALWSYDILGDKWETFPGPTGVPPNVSSYGAGVGVSETGQGYYYGGWISNTSMFGWTHPRTMSSNFYRLNYDGNKLIPRNSPADKLPRAEGAMVWIPAGDTGLLVYFGGIVDTFGNGTQAPQPMTQILVYDVAGDRWYSQTAVGTVPQARRRSCASVAWAPDRSSYNVYVWGGFPADPSAVPANITAFNDVYILSMPSFVWIKVYPGHDGNNTDANGHWSSSCNMVNGMSQMIVIGGDYPPETTVCEDAFAQHNLYTGGYTEGKGSNDTSETFWGLYNPNITTNIIPSLIYKNASVGGNKNGGATIRSPKQGYDGSASPNTNLGYLLSKNASISQRSPSRTFGGASPTNSSAPPPPLKPKGGLSKGAIAGIVIGVVVLLALVAVIWCMLARKVNQRRRQRSEAAPSMVSNPQAYGAPAPASYHGSPQPGHSPQPGYPVPYTYHMGHQQQPQYSVPHYPPPQPNEMDAYHEMAKSASPQQSDLSAVDFSHSPPSGSPPAQLSASPYSAAVELSANRRTPANP